ncbi:MAG: EamA family transporter [Acidobacteria bacterium]|nr:EamA family transporter [Acidobacteriota bacterium]
MRTPLSSILLVLFASFVGSFGAIFLKAGADRLERTVKGVLTNWRLPAGIMIYLTSFGMYTVAVKSGELTILYPMVSLGYLWTLIWSRLVFKEPLTRNKFIGVGMILFGVLVLNLGNR